MCMSMSLYLCICARVCIYANVKTQVYDCVFVYECVICICVCYVNGYSISLSVFVHNIFVCVQVRMGMCLWLYIWVSTDVGMCTIYSSLNLYIIYWWVWMCLFVCIMSICILICELANVYLWMCVYIWVLAHVYLCSLCFSS